MSNYQEDHPAAASTATEDQPAPNYEARPAPADFQSFLDEISRMARDQGGIQVDEDLWEDIFGGEDGLGRREGGASEEFIDNLPKLDDKAATVLEQGGEPATCPVCLHTLASILTEQEYAHASEGFVAGSLEDMGLRRLPCQHVVCGKCARRWLRLNNSCPMCRATLDPSVQPRADEVASGTLEEADQMLRLFRAVFGGEHPAEAQPTEREDDDREAFSSMYS